MIFIALKDNKIIHSCETQSADKVVLSMQYENIVEYDNIIHVENDSFIGKVGDDIREFDANFNLLPLSVRKEFCLIPEGKKIEGDYFVDMTISEKVEAGIIQLQEIEKIVDDRIVYKTLSELKTVPEYKEIIISELSKKCKIEAEKIFPIEKQINVLVGANEYYPEYLKGAAGIQNIKKFINIYQGIYKSNSVSIYAAETNKEIDDLFNSIVFPSESDILKGLSV